MTLPNRETKYTAGDADRFHKEVIHLRELVCILNMRLEGKDERIQKLEEIMYLREKRAEREAARAN